MEMQNEIVQREIRECDQVIVGPTRIVLIQARPPVTADEIAMYGPAPVNKPTWKMLIAASVFTAVAAAGMIELYFAVVGR